MSVGFEDGDRAKPMSTQATTSSPLLLDLLFEKAGVGLCLVAPDGRVLRANAEFLRSTPHPADPVVGESLIELLPGTRDQALALQARALAGERVEVPRHAQTRDGREAWWEGSVERVPMEGGTGLLVTAREVTAVRREAGVDEAQRAGQERAQDVIERERAEEALRLSEARLRSLGDNLPNGAIYRYEHDEGGRHRFLYISRGIERMTGVSPEELMRDASALLDTVLPEDRARLDREEARSRETLAPFEVEVRMRHRATGEERWALLRSVPQRLPGGATVWDGVHVDITARKQAEEALRENEERLRAAFAASPDAININRLRDGAYVAVNERFEQLSLWRRADVIGKTVVDLNVWVDLDERDRNMTRLLTAGSGSAQNIETRFRRKDGSVFDASISAQMFEANGERFLLAITRDISDLKRAERSLRDADRRKDDFLGMLSHELRNPLAPVRHSLYILDHTDPAGEQARHAKAVANRQVGHLAHLVDDLLDVTRVARGKIELRRDDLDLGALARRTAEDYRGLMQDRGLEFVVDVPAQPLVVNGDEPRLSQVLGNLLSNAAKFTPAGGRVTLALHVEGGRAVAEVRDTGSGIAPEVLPRIFEPFTQASQTLARSEGGLGLGLALVEGLVQMHGGSVSAASEGPGKGSTFTISLPLGVPAGEAASARRVPGGAASPRRVLVIEDNHDAADILREVLELDGHVVEVAYGGQLGIEKARAFHPDIVLCDIGLPEMDGYEVARAMRADPELRHVALVAVSGYAQPEDVATSMRAGFDAHLAKPPGIEALNRAIAELGSQGETAVDSRGDAGAPPGL